MCALGSALVSSCSRDVETFLLSAKGQVAVDPAPRDDPPPGGPALQPNPPNTPPPSPLSRQDMQLLAERTILGHLKAGGLLVGEVDAMVEARLGAVFMPHGEQGDRGLCCTVRAAGKSRHMVSSGVVFMLHGEQRLAMRADCCMVRTGGKAYMLKSDGGRRRSIPCSSYLCTCASLAPAPCCTADLPKYDSLLPHSRPLPPACRPGPLSGAEHARCGRVRARLPAAAAAGGAQQAAHGAGAGGRNGDHGGAGWV